MSYKVHSNSPEVPPRFLSIKCGPKTTPVLNPIPFLLAYLIPSFIIHCLTTSIFCSVLSVLNRPVPPLLRLKQVHELLIRCFYRQPTRNRNTILPATNLLLRKYCLFSRNRYKSRLHVWSLVN